MAKQSDAQKEIVGRVMHEFAHGELKTAAGAPVKNRRQAVAIALGEAGESNRQTPAENRKRLKATKARGREGATGRQRAEGEPTRAELYAEARRRDVPGRSTMSRAELEHALKR